VLRGIRLQNPVDSRWFKARNGMVPKRDTSSGDFARVLRESAPYLGMGTALAITVGLSFGFGYWLDGFAGTKPWLSLLFGSLGVLVALVQFVRTASTLNRPKKPIQSPDPQEDKVTKP
jgi:F0F1-type ATP synthase assembly protein I